MEEFWKALIAGLTPESHKEANLWFKIPIFLIFIVFFLALF